MKKIKNQKKIVITILLIILVTFFSTLKLFSEDPKSAFLKLITEQQKSFPETFKCQISSTIFTEYLKQLPSEAFTKPLDKVIITLEVVKGSASIVVDGVKGDYMDFVQSYFVSYLQLINLVFLSAEELEKQFADFTVSYENNQFILKSELISYAFTFKNNLLSTVSYYQAQVKQMDIVIIYFKSANYQLIKSITLINYPGDSIQNNQTNQAIILFSKYTY